MGTCNLMSKVIGYEIRLYTADGIYDRRVMFGNSPRDKKSREEFIAELQAAGTEYTVKEIRFGVEDR